MPRSGGRVGATVAGMAVRVARFTGEFAELAEWSGTPEEALRGDQRAADKERWLAWDGDQIAGLLNVWHAPDERVRLFFGRCEPEAFAPLADAIETGCYATIDAGDSQVLAALESGGFREERSENEYEIPVAVHDAPVPDGIRIITADQTELEPLMLLDCAIRADIPGADGWQPDRKWFREETYDSPDFDPAAYRVALDGEDYVGLARIWGRSPSQRYRRLGCVGVLRGYRRRGLARALIARALAPLAAAGESAVTAEADTTNVASHALLAGFGARVTGGTVELYRPGR
jgi:ribosomal protein S18 acetylase RimI-like enzyme